MFSDGYANAVISPVKTILTRLYPDWMDADKTENPTILGAVGFAGSESTWSWFEQPPRA